MNPVAEAHTRQNTCIFRPDDIGRLVVREDDLFSRANDDTFQYLPQQLRILACVSRGKK
jgi:hypothetical protein